MNTEFRTTLPDSQLCYFDVRNAVDAVEPGAYDTLPYTSRVLAENLLRCSDPNKLFASLEQIIRQKREIDFAWFPTRVVCHDILGQTALVDLAGLRNAIAKQGGDPSKVNPVVPTQLIVDHSLNVEHAGFVKDAFQKNRAIEDRRNEDRFHFINWAKRAFKNVDVIPPGNGIMHQINLERMSPIVHNNKGILYPDSLIGTDSHTPHVNSLGVLAIGVGGLEAESVMLGRPCFLRMPNITGVELVGKRQAGITATDIVLSITEYLRDMNVVSSYLEFFGEGVADLTVGDRATISNMTPEYGATAAMFYIDQQTINYLKLTGRDEYQIKLVESYAKQAGLWADSLENVQYERMLRFNLSSVGRNIAGPSCPHRRVSTNELSAKGIATELVNHDTFMPDGAVIIAAITSCTNTSNPRNMVAAALIARNANRRNLVRKPWVKTSFAPGSKTVELYLKKAKLLDDLEKLGFGIVGFACTTCNGMSGALDPIILEEIRSHEIYTTAILSGNRNFDGRIHPQVKDAFLASPPLVIAYAIAGTIRFDIEYDVLGKDKDGNPVTLKDIWPSDEEIDEIINACVKPEQFHNVYDSMFQSVDTNREKKDSLYNWRPQSTYIRCPPYWEDSLTRKRLLKAMRPLAVLPDNITTDHISPSNAITPDSAAGEYLKEMGLSEDDFNSYATHRGDHLTAQRATFANPKLLNEMVKENDLVIQGSLARMEPEGVVMRMWEAIELYMERNQSLIIIAGKNYGQGSSRDWAAKGVRLAGVEVIAAESFERIHRTNLIGMGVLPLEFKSNLNHRILKIDGSETYDVIGEFSPNADLTLIINRKNGEKINVVMTCRLDTEEEVAIYRAGGMLQRFSEEFLT